MNRRRLSGPHISKSTPRQGGLLARFVTNQDPSLSAIFEDGLVYVSVEGQAPCRAILAESDFLRITAKEADGPWLTKTRWWLDDAGMLRAFSLHDKQKFVEGTLVAAAVLNAKEGDTLELPADPFDLRLSQIRRV